MFKNFCSRLANAVAAVALVVVAAAIVGIALQTGVGLAALPLAFLALKGAAHFAGEAVKSSKSNESSWKPPKDSDYSVTNDQREREWAPQAPGRR